MPIRKRAAFPPLDPVTSGRSGLDQRRHQGAHLHADSTYDHDDGVDRRNELSRFTVRTNVDITPNEKFSASAGLGFVRGRTDLADGGFGYLFNSCSDSRHS